MLWLPWFVFIIILCEDFSQWAAVKDAKHRIWCTAACLYKVTDLSELFADVHAVELILVICAWINTTFTCWLFKQHPQFGWIQFSFNLILCLKGYEGEVSTWCHWSTRSHYPAPAAGHKYTAAAWHLLHQVPLSRLCEVSSSPHRVNAAICEDVHERRETQ